jgi:hypothetical protein
VKSDDPRSDNAERPVAERHGGRGDGGYDTIVVATGLMSIGIAAVYWAMRIGFDNPIPAVARPVGLALFISTFPFAARWALAALARDGADVTPWWRCYPFLWLVGLGLTAMVGRATPVIGFSVFPLLAVFGAIAFAVIFARWIAGAALWRSLALIFGCAVFSVWASGVVWGRIYKNPLFYENFILDGKVHHDSLALAALGNMLRAYHVASTGVDGLNYMPYHWGTPWLFAQLSNLIGAQVLDFYQLGFPVTMIPFFFGGILAFAVAMRNRRHGPDAGADLRSDFRFWLVFLAACIGIIPISGLDAMGVWTSNLLISESYTVAVPCALLMLATTIAFHDGIVTRTGQGTFTGRAVADAIFLLIGVPLGIVVLGLLKSSLMMLTFALALYALVRFRLYRRLLYSASAAIATVLFYVTYERVILPGHREGIAPFDFLWSFVKPPWWPFFIIVHLFWSWAYILVRLRSEGIGTVADLKEAATERRLIDVEVVALVALLGLGPGLVTHIDGGSAFYFSDVQRWLAVGLILSRIPTFMTAVLGKPSRTRAAKTGKLRSRLDAVRLRSIVVAFLLLPIIGSMLSNSLVWPLRMARANADTRHALYVRYETSVSEGRLVFDTIHQIQAPAPVAAGIPLGLHGLPRLHDRAILDEGLRRSPNFLVADALRRMSAMPDSVRRRTALFIAQNQSAYWHSLTRPGACTYQSLVAPALASMAMIDGMPAYGCTVSRYYGLGSFTPRRRPQTSADAEPAALCRRATAASFGQVLVLTFEAGSRATTRAVQCQPRP